MLFVLLVIVSVTPTQTKADPQGVEARFAHQIRRLSLAYMNENYFCGDEFDCSGHGTCQWRPPLSIELTESTVFGNTTAGTGSGCICEEGYGTQTCAKQCRKGHPYVSYIGLNRTNNPPTSCTKPDSGRCMPLTATCRCTSTLYNEYKGESCHSQCPTGICVTEINNLGVTLCIPRVCSGYDLVDNSSQCAPPYQTAEGLLPWPCPKHYSAKQLEEDPTLTQKWRNMRGVCEYQQTTQYNQYLDSQGCARDMPEHLLEKCHSGEPDPESGHTINGTSCRCRYDIRGWNCTLNCPRDNLNRICSGNGTCAVDASCECYPGFHGDTCEYKIVNDTYIKSHLDATQHVTRFLASTCIEGPKQNKACSFDLDCGFDCAPGMPNCFINNNEQEGINYDECRDIDGVCQPKRVFRCRPTRVCFYGMLDPRSLLREPCPTVSDGVGDHALCNPTDPQNPLYADANAIPTPPRGECIIDPNNCTRDANDPLSCIAQWSVNDVTFDSSNRITVRPPTGEISGGITINFLPNEELAFIFDSLNPLTHPVMPTARRGAATASIMWSWIAQDWPPGRNTVMEEHSILMFGGAGKPETVVILVTNSKTMRDEPEVVTRQSISQEMWMWNHTKTDLPESQRYMVPEGWKARTSSGHEVTYAWDDARFVKGSWKLANVTLYQERSSLPPKRHGHTIIYLRGGRSALLFGGYSTVCADYCRDLWEYHLPERRWSFKNMTPAASVNPLYTTWWNTQDYQNLTYWRHPAKRWMHLMASNGDNKAILFGGFFASPNDVGWLNDVWEYTLEYLPQTESCQNYDVATANLGAAFIPSECADQWRTIGYWRLLHNGTHRFKSTVGNETIYHDSGIKETGAVIKARRGHGGAFINNCLYVFGGQVLDPYNETEVKGRVKKHRARVIADLWEWNARTNTWRDITALSIRRDGFPAERYNMAYMTFKDHLIIHGGFENPYFYDDMWSFNATTLSWIKNSYAHRNQLFYYPKPEGKSQHSIGYSGSNFIIHGGFGQKCTYVYNPNEDGATSDKIRFCQASEQEPLKYFGDTWFWGHETCPNGCHGNGVCNVGFCICNQGLGSGFWGYHCGYHMCHNSTCAWDYATQHEYCTHCHNYGFCEGFQGRCHCNANHQHILPINYQQQATSRYGKDAGTQVERPDWYLKNYHTTTLSQTTTSPVPFYVEDIAFHMDERRRKDCLFVKCPHQFCSGHGYCMPNGTCHCHPEYIGSGCEYHAFCKSHCSFQGTCTPKLLDATAPWVPSAEGNCSCHTPFNGSTCKIALRNHAVTTELSSLATMITCFVAFFALR